MNFKILYCDDNLRERENLKLLIENKLSSLNGIDVEIKCEDFDNSFREIRSKYDLLILDLHDDNSSKPQKDTGVDVLIQNELQLKIPTIVYSSKTNDVQFFEDEN